MAFGVCSPWLSVSDLCDDGNDEVTAAHAIDVATAWLFVATGSIFTGSCQTVIRPNPGQCGHKHGCGCGTWRRFDLSMSVPGPVLGVTEVAVGIEIVDAAEYLFRHNRFLVPTPGGALDPWPTQNPLAPDGAPDTWSVTVEYGRLPPPDLVFAAKELATQIAAKCNGEECDLPDNATSISRDGMTIQLSVPTDGTTGLPLVDSIVANYAKRAPRRMLDPAEWGQHI